MAEEEMKHDEMKDGQENAETTDTGTEMKKDETAPEADEETETAPEETKTV